MSKLNKNYILIIFICTFLSALSPVLKLLVYLVCILISFKNINYSLMAFSLVSYINILNPRIYGWTDSTLVFIKLGFSILLFCYYFISYRKVISNLLVFRYINYFCLTILIINIFHPINTFKTISILKIISFYCTVSFIIISFSLLKNIKKIMSWLESIFYVTIFCSIAIYLFNKPLGTYMGSNDVPLFRGSLIFPNAVGIFFIPFLIYFLPEIIPIRRLPQNKLFYILISFFVIFLTFASGARGAFAGIIICFILVMFLSLFLQKFRNDILIILKNKYILFFILMVVFAAPALFAKQFISDFLLKSSEYDSFNFSDVFMASRGKFIYISYLNFLDNPFFGIGFGIPSILDFSRITFDPIFGVPISAPVEKAFLFTALLEEIGIFGLLAFFVFYIKYSIFLYKKINSIFPHILFFSILTLSIFEYYFFSMGTLGSFNWLWIGFVSNLALHQNHSINRSTFQ